MIPSISAWAALRRDTRLQLADQVVVLARPDLRRVRRERQRQEDLAVFHDAEGRHHLPRQAEPSARIPTTSKRCVFSVTDFPTIAGSPP